MTTLETTTLSRVVPMLIGALSFYACGSDPVPPSSTQPTAPSVNALEPDTRMNPITVTGQAEANATIQARGGANAIDIAQAGADGRFTINVTLRENAENAILISQVVAGVEGPSSALRITHDNIAPDTPSIEPATSPTRRTTASIRGNAEAGAKIVVRGGAAEREVDADAGGRFEVSVDLLTALSVITENSLSVVARDRAGNESGPATLSILHNPALPIDAPQMGSVPSHTSSDQITVSGMAEAGVAISIAGGLQPVMTTASVDGSFSANVALHENAVNTLSIFAIIAVTGISSAPATLVVTHDNIAPDAPALEPIESPTGAMLIRVSGTSEALATITIGGGATGEVMTTAAIDGQFSASVPLALNRENTLAIVAADAAGNASAATSVTIRQDSSLPVPVTVDPITSPTASNPVMITGQSDASVEVEITGGAQPATVMTGADGRFSVAVSLTANARNDLDVHRVGGTAHTIVVIVHDDQPPAAPSLNALTSPTNQTSLLVTGTAEANARVAISGATSPASATCGADGRFSIAVVIAGDAQTTLTAIATDRAGNASATTQLSVTHSSAVPDAPIVDVTNPAPTNVATYVVTGHLAAARAGVSVRVEGGAMIAAGAADESTGAFSIEVMLNANATNELRVVSVEGEIVSPAAIVTIEHDDVAPAAPDGAQISVGATVSAGCLARFSVGVAGAMASVEAGARVRVENMMTGGTVSTTATAGGSFSTSIPACEGDILSLVAIDAAGNVSAATEENVN